MNSFQEKIRKFCEERDWDQFHNPKDLLLGIVEEIGELRNIVKWEQDSERIKKIMENKLEEIKDHLGDIYWFLAVLANKCGIDLNRAVEEVIEKNGKRFPLEDTKGNHTNILLGGKDNQYK